MMQRNFGRKTLNFVKDDTENEENKYSSLWQRFEIKAKMERIPGGKFLDDISRVLKDLILTERFNSVRTDNKNKVELSTDSLERVLSYLGVKDLTRCRLVNKQWNHSASNHLKLKSRTITLCSGAYENSENLYKFNATLKNRGELLCPLPFAQYDIDISRKLFLEQRREGLKAFFGIISKAMCKTLRIFMNDIPQSSEIVKDAAIIRRGHMNFIHLENLEFHLKFYGGFDSEHVNMQEILEGSRGIRRIKLKSLNKHNLSSLPKYLSSSMATTWGLNNSLKRMTNPRNNFSLLNTFELEHAYLKEEQLDLLTKWKHPIQKLILGYFFLSETIQYLMNSLVKLLDSKKSSLKYLIFRLSYKSTITTLASNGFVPRPRLNFPCMKNLLTLQIGTSGYQTPINCSWLLNENKFPVHFPKLKRFLMPGFCYANDNCVDFLPKLDKPSLTVEEIMLPYSNATWCNHVVLLQMLSLYPRLKVISMYYDERSLELIFANVKTLEILRISCKNEQLWDNVLTGVPNLDLHHSHLMSSAEAQDYNVEANRTKPGLSNLTKLRELVLKLYTESRCLSNVTAYHVLLKMPQLSQVSIISSFNRRENNNNQWPFSSQCMEILRKKMKVSVTNHQ